jgi:hypothetical protein
VNRHINEETGQPELRLRFERGSQRGDQPGPR